MISKKARAFMGFTTSLLRGLAVKQMLKKIVEKDARYTVVMNVFTAAFQWKTYS